MNVLLVEDDPSIALVITAALEAEGFEVIRCDTIAERDRLLGRQDFAALVTDVMLPDGDGIDLCRRLRRQKVAGPILLLTALASTEDKVRGLDAGADDYLTKPFEFSELSARLRALLRRAAGTGAPAVLRAGDVEMDPAAREVRRAGRAVELTPREYALLEYLLRNAGRPLSRAALMEHVWGIRFDPGTNIVDVCINALRTKLDDRDRGLIQTVRGVGYAIKPPPEEG